MFNFIIFLLSTIGATLIVTQSYIFKSFRERIQKFNTTLGKLFKCCMCMGFWMGLVIQFVILLHERMEFVFYCSDVYYILYGFIGSFVCYLIYLLIKPLMDKYD